MDLSRVKAYKWLKLAESLSLIAAGIIFCTFYSNPDFTKIVGYGFATVLLIYGIIELLGCIVIRRSIFSSEIFFGLIVSSFAVMLLRYSGELSDNGGFNGIITWIFGILLAGYAVILTVSGVLNVTGEDEKRKIAVAVFEFIAAGIIIALDVVLWFYGLTTASDEANPVLVLTIGCAIILMGLAALGNVFLAGNTEKFFKKQQKSAAVAKAPEENAPAPTPKSRKNRDIVPTETKSADVPEFDATKELSASGDVKKIDDKKD